MRRPVPARAREQDIVILPVAALRAHGELLELRADDLVPLDDESGWYRFHHLFAQLLRVELKQREPGLAPGSAW